MDLFARDTWMAPVLAPVLEGQVSTVFLSMRDWPDCPGDTVPWLDEEEHARLGRFTHPGPRQRFLAGRWLVRKVIGKLVDHPLPPLHIDAQGKPHCADPAAPFFNLSHGGEWVGVAFSSRQPVGLDVEDSMRRAQFPAIADRYYGPSEQARVRERGREGFFEVWTRKEAVVKATGTGLSVRLAELDVLDLEAAGEWQFHEFKVCPGIHAALAYRGSRVRAPMLRLQADGTILSHE